MRLALRLALRNIFRHRGRSLITISTITFGCVALIFVGGFFEDVSLQMREAYISSQLGHIQVYRRGFNEHGRKEPYKYLIDNPDVVKALLRTFPEVQYATSRLQFSGLLSTGIKTATFIGQGIEVRNEKTVSRDPGEGTRAFVKKNPESLPMVIEGRGLSDVGAYEILLGKGLAENMKAAINSPVTLLTNSVHGAINALDVNIRGVFETAQKDFDDIFIRLPLATAQRLLSTRSVQSVVIKLRRTEDTERIYKSLARMIKVKKMDLELRRWEDLADFYYKTVALFQTFYRVIRLVVGIVVVLGIFNTMNMSVMERITEIGTIMALGARRRGVMILFLLEGLLLGCIGGGVGTICGIVVVRAVSKVGIVMPPAPGTTSEWLATVQIVPSIILSTFVLAVLVGGISSLYPAYKASRLQIVEALRYR